MKALRLEIEEISGAEDRGISEYLVVVISALARLALFCVLHHGGFRQLLDPSLSAEITSYKPTSQD
jgi:hypothetical protein